MFSDVLLKHINDVKQASYTIDTGRRSVLIANLIFLHDAVVASEQLLIEAAEAIDLLSQSSFHTRLATYYRSHLDEERDHVKWVREDLKSVGVNVPAELPGNLAMAMAGSQYYLLKHAHPAALLGYMAVLEGDPTPLETIDFLEQAYGKQLLRFARIHATKDLEHRKDLFEVIDNAPTSLRRLIAYSTDNTLDFMIAAARTWAR
jgi:Iron-containing redox enzyme